MQPPTVSEFNPYTGVETYRADGRVVEITLADGQSGVDNGQAPTTTSMAPTIDWEMSDGTSGSVTMTETEACDMSVLPYMIVSVHSQEHCLKLHPLEQQCLTLLLSKMLVSRQIMDLFTQ